MKAEIEITADDRYFRVIPMEIKKVSIEEGRRCLAAVEKTLKDYEFVYQICAPCHGCSLSQPFYDFWNGFSLLDANYWQYHNLPLWKRLLKRLTRLWSVYA